MRASTYASVDEMLVAARSGLDRLHLEWRLHPASAFNSALTLSS